MNCKWDSESKEGKGGKQMQSAIMTQKASYQLMIDCLVLLKNIFLITFLEDIEVVDHDHESASVLSQYLIALLRFCQSFLIFINHNLNIWRNVFVFDHFICKVHANTYGIT
jgi:hypothetical protein